MADTLRTLAALQALMPDGGHITAQDMRDLLVSVYPTDRVLLATLTASSSSSLDFTSRNAPLQSGALFQSDFDEYEIHFTNVTDVSDGAWLVFRVSSNGGSTWKSASGDYFFLLKWEANNSSQGVQNDNSYSSTWGLVHAGADTGGSAGAIGYSGKMLIYKPTTAEQHKWFSSGVYLTTSGGNLFEHDRVGGWITAAAAIDSIQFFNGGTIASGTIRVFGVCK